MAYAEIVAEVLEAERVAAERQGDEVDSKPRPPASEEAIAKAEEARGMRFSDAYRTFLRTCDGWDHFAWGISLFGTEELAGEAYDEVLETLSYTDDVPDELEAALIIGANENDATLIMLLESGEVVDHLYEEKQRWPDLESYLRSRVTVLEEMGERAREARMRTEREWDPAVRAADDAALADELRAVLAAAEPDLPAIDRAALADGRAGPTPGPAELVLRNEDGDIGASLDLGLVLYLGAAPTREETLATFRAFRRHFRFPGPMKWMIASPMSFFPDEEEDPDAEPFADRLDIDDQGFFGVRIQAGEGTREHVLNVRGIPPEEVYPDEDDDDDADAEPVYERRASFVEVLVPCDSDPEALRALCLELTDILPVRSGHAGYFARVHDTDFEPDPWDTVFTWCRRYFSIEPCYVDGWLGGAMTRHRGAGWLTVLGRPFVEALGELELSAAVRRDDRAHGVVLTAGELTLGDVARGGFPEPVAEVSWLLAPVSLSGWTKRGMLSMGGVYFSTFASELPGAFADHHATAAFMRRFVDPRGFVGETARERGLALIERLRASMDAKTRKKWDAPADPEEIDSFGMLLRLLYNGAYFTKDRALAIEALEHAARFPDWAPNETYNNLLHYYLTADRLPDALEIMPVALETAKKNVFTYHNAACALVKAGRLDEAMDCVRRAAEGAYPHMDKLEADDDLAPLRAREDWKALFASE